MAQLRSLRKSEAFWFYLFILPGLLGFLLFYFGPMLASLIFSFTKYDIVHKPTFIGLANYAKMFLDDPLVRKSLQVTTVWTIVGVPLRLLAQLMIAVLLNRAIRGMTFFRSLLYLPSIVAGVAMSLAWMFLLNSEYGLVNYVFWRLFHIQGPAWLYNTHWVIPAMLVMSFWGIGPGIVINLAGLQSIPRELYEAAELDGATGFRKFLNVTLPMMSPILLFNLVNGIIGNFQVFTQAYVMTNGGPNNASLFYMLYLYRNAYQFLQMGYASALAWLLFVIILILTLLVFKSSPVWVFYQDRR